MAGDNLCRVFRAGEVVGPVPFHEEGKITEKFGEKIRGAGAIQGLEARLEGFGQVRGGADGRGGWGSGWVQAVFAVSAVFSAVRFLRWMSSKERAAGVIPGMREAWAILWGRVAASFCRASLDRP